jgi:hypothetical protein
VNPRNKSACGYSTNQTTDLKHRRQPNVLPNGEYFSGQKVSDRWSLMAGQKQKKRFRKTNPAKISKIQLVGYRTHLNLNCKLFLSEKCFYDDPQSGE